MNALTKTLGLTALVLGIGAGCSDNSDIDKNSTTRKSVLPAYEIVIGKPVTMDDDVLLIDSGNSLIVSRLRTGNLTYNSTYALKIFLKHEIEDGDNQSINVKGKYSDYKGYKIIEIYEVDVENKHFKFWSDADYERDSYENHK